MPVFQQMAWDGMLLAVSQGQVDVAADGITYTDERAQTVDFSSLYQSYDETLLVRADEDRFTNADELKAIPDYLVATQIGTTNEITAHNLFGQDQRQILRPVPGWRFRRCSTRKSMPSWLTVRLPKASSPPRAA